MEGVDVIPWDDLPVVLNNMTSATIYRAHCVESRPHCGII